MRYTQDLGMAPELASFNLFDNPVSKNIWKLKYRRGNEKSIHDTIDRVINGIYPVDETNHDSICQERAEVAQLIHAGIIIPGGRILAEAGTLNNSTLMNCYVMGEIEDSVEGIFKILRESAITSSQGGGVGLDFSTLRPKGAEIKGSEAVSAGGPVAFMKMWDAMGHSFEAGGNRRGGKMAVLSVDHPDIVEFIKSKREPGVLTSFNLSVAVTDTFMRAVADDLDWELVSKHPKKGAEKKLTYSGYFQWDVVRARELWNLIMKSNYEFAEPGVLFIDRINEKNNLKDFETIRATNPCGEQPLPPYGACNLGSVNLALCVTNPFGYENAEVNYQLIEKATLRLADFLDRVIDFTQYPLEEQRQEALNKRRIGIGITGLADMFAQLRIPYESEQALRIAEDVMSFIRYCAYRRSAERADLYGIAPVWTVRPLEGTMNSLPFFRDLPGDTQNLIYEYGLRNSHLTSIAPTGTIATVFGDVSTGCEPIFAHQMERKVIVKDDINNDTWKSHISWSFTVRLYAHIHNLSLEEAWSTLKVSTFMSTATSIEPAVHVKMVAALQKSVDAAISKTVNVPEDTTFENFCSIYETAYLLGCKGCTTYRPSETRGTVLADVERTEDKAKQKDKPKQKQATWKRPEKLEGVTYKFDWPGYSSSIYVTINSHEGHPVEMFISSKNEAMNEWSAALSVVISSLLQAGKSAREISKQLSSIRLSSSPAFKGGRVYGSIIEMIGELLHPTTPNEVLQDVIGKAASRTNNPDDAVTTILPIERAVTLSTPMCPECGSVTFNHIQGCKVCNGCSYSICS